jgi:superfamily II DNA or RNA helicase
MAVIQVENCYSWLEEAPDEVKETLWRALRFPERGYFHSRLYKQKLWDGYTNFFIKNSGRFLTGLLPEIEAALKHLGVQYKINDYRNPVEFRVSSIDANFLQKWQTPGNKPFVLYDYQVDLTNEIIKYKRGIIDAKTASGKTEIMVSILKALPQNCPTLILANKTGLVDQNYQKLVDWGFKNIGRLYSKYNDPNIFTCATVQSLHKIEHILPKIRALIVDEIHENMSRVPKRFFNKLKSCSVRVAVSATPFKFGGTDKGQKWSVKGYFGPPMRSTSVGGVITTQELQDRGILALSRCIFYPVDEPQLPYDTYQDAIKRGVAENWKFHETVARLAKSLEGRTLILVDRIAHGDALKSIIPEMLWIQGKDDLDTRRIVINELTSSTKVIACATQQIFNAGINVKCHNVINAACGKADHQILQRVGRGLRTAKDKEILNYYDFVFNINDYLYDHSKKRIKILKKEGHELIIKDKIDF